MSKVSDFRLFIAEEFVNDLGVDLEHGYELADKLWEDAKKDKRAQTKLGKFVRMFKEES